MVVRLCNRLKLRMVLVMCLWKLNGRVIYMLCCRRPIYVVLVLIPLIGRGIRVMKKLRDLVTRLLLITLWRVSFTRVARVMVLRPMLLIWIRM